MGQNIENTGDIIIYQTEDGLTKINVNIQGETVWLSLDLMAELFQRDKSTISRHIKNIFSEGELSPNSVVAKFATTATDGKIYQVDYYNLDIIISVGYRVKSVRGTQFRIWATQRLKEYMIKGFTMDDERLKGNGGGNYWKELLDRIRDIRSSEKVLYRPHFRQPSVARRCRLCKPCPSLGEGHRRIPKIPEQYPLARGRSLFGNCKRNS